MTKSKNGTRTSTSTYYETRARGRFEHSSTIYRPVKSSTSIIIKPSPRSCFYSRIMAMINKLK